MNNIVSLRYGGLLHGKGHKSQKAPQPFPRAHWEAVTIIIRRLLRKRHYHNRIGLVTITKLD